MSDTSSKWHWGEGIKYALEGLKLLFMINGASAVSILTFVGTTKICSRILVCSLISFALGAASGIPSMMLAYFTQLYYGNAENNVQGSEQQKVTMKTAYKFHNATYWCTGFGILLFLTGVGFAAWGLLELLPPEPVK